jgi:hypothetical protein
MCREYELFKYCSKEVVAAYYGVELERKVEVKK